MTWILVKNHLRHPALWTTATVASIGAVFEQTFMGASGLFVLVAMVPTMVPPSVSVFEAALPISARTIMRARLLSALALATPLLATVLIATPLRMGGSHDPVRVLFAAVLVATAAMMIYLVPGRIGPPPRVHIIAASLFIGAGAALAYTLPSNIALGVALVVAVVCYCILIARIPQLIVSREKRSARRVPKSDKRSREVESSWPWMALRRTILPGTIAMLPLLAPGVGTSSYGASFLFLGGVLMTLTMNLRSGMAWMAQLPFSPRVRLLLMIGPAFVLSFVPAAIVANISAFKYGSLTTGAPRTEGDYRVTTRVAINHWQRYDGETAPTISAPWGETIAADTLSVFGVNIFNPYTTRQSTSEEFRVWQFERATTAVLGVPISREEYRRLDSINAVPVAAARTSRLVYVRLGCISALSLAVLFLIEVTRWHRLRRREWLSLLFGGLPFLLVPSLIAEIMFHVRTGGDLIVPLIDAAMLRVSPWLPESTLLTVLVCVVPSIALYLLLEWQFKRSERSSLEFLVATMPQ